MLRSGEQWKIAGAPARNRPESKQHCPKVGLSVSAPDVAIGTFVRHPV